MAAPVVRTATDELIDALRALCDVHRFAADTDDHLHAAFGRDGDALQATLAQAARTAAIAAASAQDVQRLIREAQRLAGPAR